VTTGLDRALVTWVLDQAEPGAIVDNVVGLRDGGSPWRVDLRWGSRSESVVLRVGTAADRAAVTSELAALTLAGELDVPIARLLAGDAELDPPRLLIETVDGASTIPHDVPTHRLRTLGAVAARLHHAHPAEHLARRDRPIAAVDFDAVRRAQPAVAVLDAAQQAVATYRPSGPDGFVHGDLWQGNALWRGDELAAVIDWDCAGRGPAGVDLGSQRCDAAVCFGVDAAAEVLSGWAQAAGRPADDVAYWDLVAALSTPPDMGWFAGAIAGQGRPDLTRGLLVARRDQFAAAALERIGT
jgi:aminoglycoside phosphotransferase (APT) family kinase protein